MEDSRKESDESTPAGRATGRIDIQYTKGNGTVQKASLIEFRLRTEYDPRSRDWTSDGDVRSNTLPPHEYQMKLTYVESARTLTVTLQGYVFTVPGTHMQAMKYGASINVSFLKDAHGSTDAKEDEYLIKGGSRLSLPL
jgi:hypothetical protein